MAKNKTLSNIRMKKILFLTTLCLSHSALASDEASLIERIERLEHHVQILEQYHTLNKDSGSVDKPADTGYANINYWLGTQPAFSNQNQTISPIASGQIQLKNDFTLSPKAYGVGDNSQIVFSHYLDPSRFPVASLSVDGTLMLPAPGNYTLQFKPTPPREVGGAGNVELAFRIYIDEQLVFSQDYSSTLMPSSTNLMLENTASPFRMELIARSPGFGPSPTRARVFVGLQSSTAVKAVPIGNYLIP